MLLGGFEEEQYAAGVLLARILLYETKDYARAEHVGDALVNLKPKLREGHYVLAESFYWREEYPRALLIFDKTTRIERPIDVTMWLWEEVYTWLPFDRISRNYEQLGKNNSAIKVAEQQMNWGFDP